MKRFPSARIVGHLWLGALYFEFLRLVHAAHRFIVLGSFPYRLAAHIHRENNSLHLLVPRYLIDIGAAKYSCAATVLLVDPKELGLIQL